MIFGGHPRLRNHNIQCFLWSIVVCIISCQALTVLRRDPARWHGVVLCSMAAVLAGVVSVGWWSLRKQIIEVIELRKNVEKQRATIEAMKKWRDKWDLEDRKNSLDS
jgi:hypothetical protein